MEPCVAELSTDVVITTKTDRIGRIILNRPKAINALDYVMVRRIEEVLCEWETDDQVELVLLSGEGSRGLCAGGDVRLLYNGAVAGGGPTRDFFREEYRMVHHIASYPKPFVTLMDGLVLGAGVGVAGHGSHRIVTERSAVGMPEVNIGLVPDVGGSYLLSRAPGETGTLLGLTASTMTAGEAIHCGFADYYLPSDRLEEFVGLLMEHDLPAALNRCAEQPPASVLAESADWHQSCLSAATLEEALLRMQDSGEVDAAAALTRIATMSPTALAVAFEAVRRARELPTIGAVIDQEFRVSWVCSASHDLVEGIRAQVIDKDRNPRWSPATLDAVSDSTVQQHFAGLGPDELGLAEPAAA
jgi:enoyl-CoA hydratase